MKTKDILFFLKEHPDKTYRIKDLIKAMGVSGKEFGDIKAGLVQLVRANRVERIGGNRYKYRAQPLIFEGIVQLSERGFGFVIPFDEKIDDIFVPAMKLNGALNGDTVRVREEYFRGKREGRILDILERSIVEVPGVLSGDYLEPIDSQLPQYIPVTNAKKFDISDEDIVVSAKIVKYYPLTAEITEVLGKYNDPKIDDDIVISKYNLKKDYPNIKEEYYDELYKEYKKELKRREDFTHLLTLTIDPADAKDSDDAVSIERIENGWRLYVHIADVSFYVKEGSLIDNAAYERGFSSYLVDKFLPMLPLRITRDFCSLREGEEKLAMTAIMDIDFEGNIIDKKVVKSKVLIDKFFSYDEVYQLFENGQENENNKIYVTLKEMRNCAERLYKNRIKRGAIDFDLPEFLIKLDENKMPVEVKPYERNFSHRMIEEFMLLANESVALILEEKDVFSIFRVHEKPSQEKLTDYRNLLKIFNITMKKLSPGKLRKVVKKITDTPAESFLKRELLKSFKQARYSEENIGHFGLHLDSYTHFTSPIRRYSDLVIHRLLNGKNYKKKRLKEIAKYISKKERIIDKAEAKSYQIKILRYLNALEEPLLNGLVVDIDVDKARVELIDYNIKGNAFFKDSEIDLSMLYPGMFVKVVPILIDPIYSILELKILEYGDNDNEENI